MKIMYVITQGTWGGAQAHLFSLIRSQVALGNQVWLITGTSGRLTQTVESEFPTVNVFILNYLVRQMSIRKDLCTAHVLRKYFKKINPDIIHLHSTKAGMVGRIAAIGIKSKVIYTVHGWAFTPGVSLKQRYLARVVEMLLQPLTSVYICVSKYDYDLGCRMRIINGRHPGIVIKNGVIKQVYKVQKEKRFFLTMAARFDKQKRQDILIRALAEANISEIKVCLLGSGPSLEQCKKLAEDLGLKANIFFAGSVNNVQKYYAQSAVGILISDYEGLPVSLVEAIAQGLPIIASNVGGNNELINHNGYLVENDPRDIASKIKILSENAVLRNSLGLQSVKVFEDEYTEKKMLQHTNQVYVQLLGEK